MTERSLEAICADACAALAADRRPRRPSPRPVAADRPDRDGRDELVASRRPPSTRVASSWTGSRPTRRSGRRRRRPSGDRWVEARASDDEAVKRWQDDATSEDGMSAVNAIGFVALFAGSLIGAIVALAGADRAQSGAAHVAARHAGGQRGGRLRHRHGHRRVPGASRVAAGVAGLRGAGPARRAVDLLVVQRRIDAAVAGRQAGLGRSPTRPPTCSAHSSRASRVMRWCRRLS